MNEFGSPFELFLDPGEKLLWSGQPKQGVRLQASDALMIPFSLMWGGFAIFWEIGALGATFAYHNGHLPKNYGIAAWLFPLWGIPFVAIGLYMIFGRFFYDAALRNKTWYGITDRRLIVLKSLFNRNVNSFDYATLTNLNLVERGDCSGDILFGTPTPFAGFANSSWPRSSRYAVPGFYLLPNARQVFNRIQATHQSVKQ
jgi:hypothetical protein